MDASGSTREGWMAIIPVTVLVLIVMYVVGGPVAFVNIVHQWGSEFVGYVSSVVKHL